MRRAPLAVDVRFDRGGDIPRDEFAVRAFHEGREVGQINGIVRRGAMLTIFMSTRYVKFNGRRAAVLLTDKGETDQIPHEDYTGRGVGKALLDALVKEACRRGLIVASHTDRSPMMERFWAKQVAAGRATTRPAAPAYDGDQDYEYVVHKPCEHRGFLGLRVRAAQAAVAGTTRETTMTCRTFTFADARRAAKKLGVEGFVPVRVLREGMNVEREHRDIGACRSPVLAARIALAHLRERADYYARLRRYVER